MADKFINETGVATIRDWANSKFAKDADLDALDARVDEIIAEGGEPNTIETVKVNGTALTPDAQKAVDVTVPTATSDLTNDGDGTSNFATEAYVDNNGGKIQKVKYDGTELTIDTTDKSVNVPKEVFLAIYGTTTRDELYNAVYGDKKDILVYKNGVYISPIQCVILSDNAMAMMYVEQNKMKRMLCNSDNQWTEEVRFTYALTSDIPTNVSDLTNDSNFQNETQVDAKIASAVASAVTLKGSVATYDDLPSTGQKHGDLYDVLDTGRNYVWLVEEGTGRWDDYAGAMDLSAYWTSTTGQTNTLEAMTVAEINAILEPSA